MEEAEEEGGRIPWASQLYISIPPSFFLFLPYPFFFLLYTVVEQAELVELVFVKGKAKEGGAS